MDLKTESVKCVKQTERDREGGRERCGVLRETRAIALELKLQPQGENSALSAPINLIRIPDMRAGG